MLLEICFGRVSRCQQGPFQRSVEIFPCSSSPPLATWRISMGYFPLRSRFSCSPKRNTRPSGTCVYERRLMGRRSSNSCVRVRGGGGGYQVKKIVVRGIALARYCTLGEGLDGVGFRIGVVGWWFCGCWIQPWLGSRRKRGGGRKRARGMGWC